MEDAILDCREGPETDNDAGVHAWDEFVAFYAGSLEGTEVGGLAAGELSYRLAEKRCANYGTCTGPGGMSQVNANIMAAADTGRDLLAAGDCDGAAVQMQIIKKQMLVPLVQGTLRYAYKADPALPQPDTTPAKEIGEGWAFAAAILPEVHACDADVATMLRANMDVTAETAVSHGYAAVVSGLQCVYECLGITCADVGGLLDGDTGSYHAGHAPCVALPDCSSTAPATPQTSSPPAPPRANGAVEAAMQFVIMAVTIVALLL